MILGVDLSLTATGLAEWHAGRLTLETIDTRDLTGMPRLAHICGRIWDRTRHHHPDCLVVIEGLAFGAKGNSLLDLAGLRTVLEYSLWSSESLTMDVPPANLKKYATGSGNASKEDVRVHVDRRYRHIAEPRNNNEADALVLVAMALEYYGHALLVDVPKINRSALSAGKRPLRWPPYTLTEDDRA